MPLRLAVVDGRPAVLAYLEWCAIVCSFLGLLQVSEELQALQAKNTSEAEAFVESIHVGLDERRVAAVDQIIGKDSVPS